jgi:two-component system, sporulation sensor kinase D
MLFAMAVLIFVASLWYINSVAGNIASEERNKIKLWADAINKKAALVNATDTFFNKIQQEERNKVELWARANEYLINSDENLSFATEIIEMNNTIPVFLTDEKHRFTKIFRNIDFVPVPGEYLKDSLLKEFSVYPPIEVKIGSENKYYLYYKESRIYTELRDVLNKQIRDFLSEIVTNSPSVPVVITDQLRSRVIVSGKIEKKLINSQASLTRTISQMEKANKAIEIALPGQGKCFVFYEKSYLLTQLQYYPFIQFMIIGVFLLVAYLLFSASRRVEQNQVWVGMARETAHQLGTPLSSLMAWIELLKMKNVGEDTVAEVTKDVRRLETITERFSKIGSAPSLAPENIVKVIYDSIAYLKSRTSKKVNYVINIPESNQLFIPMSRYLFEWVIENLCKNAIDAMGGTGTIQIDMAEDHHFVMIDINDTGKGIPKGQQKAIFNPGYSSKKVGWGLGLTLSERIIEQYHKGHIFVKSSVQGKGTTFRIMLKKGKDHNK